MRRLCDICHHNLSPRDLMRGLLRFPTRVVYTSATGARRACMARWICAYCENTWAAREEGEDAGPVAASESDA